MKITADHITQIIQEEIQSDPALLAALNSLLDKLDKLATSIDYLAAAATGQSPLDIQASQSALGRLAMPYFTEE